MAITVYATTNTTISPKQFAEMQFPYAAGFQVDDPDSLKPTALNNHKVRISAGRAVVGGTRVYITGEETVQIPTNTSAWYALVLRVNFSTGAASIVPVKSSNSGKSFNYRRGGTSGLTEGVNFSQGVMYDGILAFVRVQIGNPTGPVAELQDRRVYSGLGGTFMVPDSAYDDTFFLDLPTGSEIRRAGNAGKGAEKFKKLQPDGSWVEMGVASSELRDGLSGKADVKHVHKSAEISDTAHIVGESAAAGKIVRARPGGGEVYYMASPTNPYEVVNKKYADDILTRANNNANNKVDTEISKLTKQYNDDYSNNKWTFVKIGDVVWCRIWAAEVGDGLNLGKDSKYRPWMNHFSAALTPNGADPIMPYVDYQNETFTVKGRSGTKVYGVFSYPGF